MYKNSVIMQFCNHIVSLCNRFVKFSENENSGKKRNFSAVLYKKIYRILCRFAVEKEEIKIPE